MEQEKQEGKSRTLNKSIQNCHNILRSLFGLFEVVIMKLSSIILKNLWKKSYTSISKCGFV